jgi:hypothetical protein
MVKLKEFGSGARWLILSVHNLEILYAEAFRQFTTGRMGWSVLCNFIRHLMEGADGFILMYFHLCSFGIRFGLCLIAALIWVWNAGVGSVVLVWKSWLRSKSCNLVSYWWVGSFTIELPLSARAISASLSFTFLWIQFNTLASGCVLWVGLFLWSVSIWSATNFL